MTIHDDVAELRAELAGCVITQPERRAIKAELAKALARAAAIEAVPIGEAAA